VSRVSAPKTIQSVERFLDVLFSFTEDHPRWRVSDLSEKLGLHPSTVSRLLSTGRRVGIVERDPENGEYRLGLKLLAFSQVITSYLNPVQIAYPFLSWLTEESQENSYLAVLDGLEAVTVAQVAGPRLLAVRPTVGLREAPNCTSGGKVLLAYGPQERVEAFIAQGLVARTPKTTVNPDQFRAELRRIREQGYAIADEELEEGLIAIAAPVCNGHGQVIAAVNASGSSAIIREERLERIIELVCKAGEQISRALRTVPAEIWIRPVSLAPTYRP